MILSGAGPADPADFLYTGKDGYGFSDHRSDRPQCDD